MIVEKSTVQKAREVVALLPKENCGKCGYDNCGRFALAVIEESASPFGCHHNPEAGYEICRVLGREVPESVKLSAGSLGCHRGRHQDHGPGHHGHGHGHRHSGGHHYRHGL